MNGKDLLSSRKRHGACLPEASPGKTDFPRYKGRERGQCDTSTHGRQPHWISRRHPVNECERDHDSESYVGSAISSSRKTGAPRLQTSYSVRRATGGGSRGRLSRSPHLRYRRDQMCSQRRIRSIEAYFLPTSAFCSSASRIVMDLPA